MPVKRILLFRSKPDDASAEDVYEKVRFYSNESIIIINLVVK